MEVESALAKPPAKADFRTDPAGISTGGAIGTTVAASNHTILIIKPYTTNKQPSRQNYTHSHRQNQIMSTRYGIAIQKSHNKLASTVDRLPDAPVGAKA